MSLSRLTERMRVVTISEACFGEDKKNAPSTWLSIVRINLTKALRVPRGLGVAATAQLRSHVAQVANLLFRRLPACGRSMLRHLPCIHRPTNTAINSRSTTPLVQVWSGVCAQCVARFASTTNATVAERSAKDCLVAPPASASLETLSRMAERQSPRVRSIEIGHTSSS